MPVLADIFSAGNTLKRRMKDFVADPGAFLETEVNYRNQKAGEFNTLQDLATQGDINKMRGLPVTQEQQAAELRLRDIVAGAYNPVGMTAYHGSPYLFPRFDPRKMGTGEGAQAYGVGSGYTAESRGVAEAYRDILSSPRNQTMRQKGVYIEPSPMGDGTWRLAQSDTMIGGIPQGRTGDITQGITDYNFKNVASAVKYAKKKGLLDKNQKVNLTEIAEEGKYNPVRSAKEMEDSSYNQLIASQPGYLYKGDIPDEIIPKFLDYDAPLKDQSPEVQALAKSLGMDLEDLGGDLLGKVGKTVKGTLQMQGAGIKGIKYLDQGSRGQGKGTSNYIPFSPDDFKIQEINDEPLEAWLKSGRLKVDESDPLMQFLGQK
jgi:hypothetical protein